MKIKEGLKVRTIAGESVVLMQAKGVVDMTKVVSLNKSSLYLWNELVGKEFEIEDVASKLMDNYEVEEERARADAAKWVEKMQDSGVII